MDKKQLIANKPNRIRYIDFAKGIGIILVVIGHMIPSWYGVGLWIYSFHMPLFFLISGVLHYKKYSDTVNYNLSDVAISKAKSLLYPYAVFSLLYIIIFSLYKGFSVELFISTITLDGKSAFWFLPGLFIAEIVFFAVKKILKKWWSISIFYIIVLIATSVFSFYYDYNSDAVIQKFFLRFLNIFNRALIGSIFLFLGYLFMIIKSRINLKKVSICLIGFFAFAVNLASFFTFHNFVDLHYSIIGNPIVYYLNAISGSVFILIFCYLLNSFNLNLCKFDLISFFGKNSIIILATHLNFGLTTISYKLVIFDFITDIQAIFILLIMETILILVINKWFKLIYDYKSLVAVIHKIANKITNRNK